MNSLRARYYFFCKFTLEVAFNILTAKRFF
jgi:hypothetical protein